MQTAPFKFPSRIACSASVDTNKVHVLLLIFITAFGASGIYAPSLLASNPSRDSSYSSAILNDHIFDTVVQQMYLAPENEDSYGLQSKDSPDQGSALVPDYLKNAALKTGFEPLLDSINSFHYVLNYGFLPLRSPPVFS